MTFDNASKSNQRFLFISGLIASLTWSVGLLMMILWYVSYSMDNPSFSYVACFLIEAVHFCSCQLTGVVKADKTLPTFNTQSTTNDSVTSSQAVTKGFIESSLEKLFETSKSLLRKNLCVIVCCTSTQRMLKD